MHLFSGLSYAYQDPTQLVAHFVGTLRIETFIVRVMRLAPAMPCDTNAERKTRAAGAIVHGSNFC